MAKDRVDRDEEDLVRLYLTDIGQYALLTKDDEVRLAKVLLLDVEGALQHGHNTLGMHIHQAPFPHTLFIMDDRK